MAINKPFVAKHGLAIANTTHIVFNPDGTLHANNANVQVSLDTSTLVTNANFQSALANTNVYISTKTDDSTVLATNTALRTLISDRIQVANLNSTLADYVTNTSFQSVVANTNLAIADRMQVANTVALVNDRIQVANADTRFLRKDGTDSQSVGGQVTFDNNVVISGNLTVSGTRTEVNTTQVNVSNTYILLNSDLGSGDAATENAGLIINRGAEANVYFRWNETDEHFEWGEADGTFRKITDAAATVVQARNESGATISTGSPVYVTGYSAGGSKPLIDIADADDAAKMPALGITLAEVTNNSDVLVGTYGVFSEANTGVFTEGDELYIDTVAGKLTATRPTGSTTKIQKIGQVLRSHASAGSILIQGAGRSNDIPNLPLSQVFIGNTSGVGEARQLTVSDLSDANTLATNSAFQAALANTDSFVANVASEVDQLNTNLIGTNTALRTLISDRMQVANVTSTFITNTAFQAYVANTNARFTANTSVANASFESTNNTITFNRQDSSVFDVVLTGITGSGGSANTEDITNQLFKTKQLSTTRTFTVTVGTKTLSPWAGGSSSAYFIDGEEVPTLTLVPGFTYRFDQSDASNSSHPISFYREADKTTSYVTGVGGTGTAGSSGAYTEIQVSANTPMSLFYQCQNHGYMGGQIATVSDTSPKYVEQSNVTVTLGSYWPSSNIISYINTNAGGVTNTNFQSYVANTNSRLTTLEGSSGVTLAAFSVSTGTPTGGGSLAYNDQNGTFTFRPSGAFPTISTTAPSLSGNGTLWFDSEDASLFIEYDGNWVSAAPVVGSSPNNFISYSGNNTLRLVTGDGEFIDADMAQIGAAGGATGTDTDLTGSARSYTANGSVTDFLAAFARDNPEDVFVTVDGITQRPTTQYTISGTTVSFGTPPANNAVVMIRTFNGLLGTNTASIDVNKYTANGTQTTGFFSPSNSALVNDLIVTINGVVQKPTTDYTLSAQTVTFATAPVAASDIAIRALRTRIADVTEISQYVFSNSTVVTSANSNLDSNILVATYNANGTATSFAANTNSITLDTSIVSVSGLLQRPVTDYTLSGNNIVFGTAPANNDVVSVREFRHPATLTQIQMNIVPWQEISSNGAVLSNYNYFVDCSAEPITITLPSVKNQGDTIKIIDATGKASNNNITVNGAGSKIMGDAADFTVSDDRAAFTLVYYNTQQGWILGEV